MSHKDVPQMYPTACVDIHTELRHGVTTARMVELREEHMRRTGLPCDHLPNPFQVTVSEQAAALGAQPWLRPRKIS